MSRHVDIRRALRVVQLLLVHQTLRVTPAMEAGVTKRLWEVSDLVALLEDSEAHRAA